MKPELLTQKPAIKNAVFWVFGLGIGWLLTSLNQPPVGEQRQDRADEALLGFHHSYGAAARVSAAQSGIALPPQGTDAYYGIGGVQPVWEFIAVTLPREQAWPWLSALSGTTKTNAVPVRLTTPEDFSPLERTVLFQPRGSSTNSVVQWATGNSLTARAAVDEATGRVFISIAK